MNYKAVSSAQQEMLNCCCVEWACRRLRAKMVKVGMIEVVVAMVHGKPASCIRLLKPYTPATATSDSDATDLAADEDGAAVDEDEQDADVHGGLGASMGVLDVEESLMRQFLDVVCEVRQLTWVLIRSAWLTQQKI